MSQVLPFFEKILKFIDDHFYPLLMLVIFNILLVIALHLVHRRSDATVIEWIQNLAGQAFASITTLVVGRKPQTPSDAVTDPDKSSVTTVTTATTEKGGK